MPHTSPPLLPRLRSVLTDHFALTDCSGTTEPRGAEALLLKDGSTRRFFVNDASPPVELRIAGVLDVHADAYIVDHDLGTLGLVHLIHPATEAPPAPTASAQDQSIRDQINKRIGEAAYLRHLLLANLRPGEVMQGHAAYSVEVVFLLTRSSQEDARLRTQVGDALQDVAREFAVLHAIGVSILEPTANPAAPGGSPTPPPPLFRPSDLHRAFSWLLHQTREWMTTEIASRQPTASPGTPTAPGATPAAATPPANTSPIFPTQPPSALLLKNFRLRGSRRWQLAANRGLHLVHGHNGSGKSSFVEAIELVTTGRIEKLGTSNCRDVITNRSVQAKRRTRGPAPAAAVMLQFPAPAPGTPAADPAADARSTPAPPIQLHAWRLTDQGIDQPLAKDRFSLPGAFRLNQDVIKLLSQSSSKDQARILFETFFPDGHALVSQSQRLLAQRNETLRKLPARIRTQFENTTGVYDKPRADSALAWVQDTGIPWDRLPGLVPLDSSHIHALQPLLGLSFESHYRRTGTAASWEPVLDAARALDDSLRAVLEQTPNLLNHLRAARDFLTAYQEATAVAPETSDAELPDLFRRWLELLAATDILQREHDLLLTLEAVDPGSTAVPAGVFPTETLPVLASPSLRDSGSLPNPAERASHCQQSLLRRDQARQRVSGFVSATDRERQASTPLPPLAQFELSALDALAAAGVFGREFTSTTPRFSQAVRTAFQEGRITAVSQGERTLARVGEPGALRELNTRIERVMAALQALESARAELTGADGGALGVLHALRTLRQLAQQEQTVQSEAAAQFLVRLQTPLGAALNEFTAMLTPARWAYDDIISRVNGKDAEPGLAFVQGGQPAQLRLNTAQLSTFALAFFLLCHRAREHPLRLGILDDPFENMDELTVTTVARGLGRFLRLRTRLRDGPESWQLLLFLHGEQNVERVRREVPCATYYLPWLSPGAELGREPAIAAEKLETIGETLQDLTHLISVTTATP